MFFFQPTIDLVGGTVTSALTPWNGMRHILSLLLYASLSKCIAAPFAAFILFKAIDPEASAKFELRYDELNRFKQNLDVIFSLPTRKITRVPAFRDIRLIRKSSFSIITMRPSFLVPIDLFFLDF